MLVPIKSLPPGATSAAGGAGWTFAKQDAATTTITTACIGTDEGVPTGSASAAGGANWTFAKEVATTGSRFLGGVRPLLGDLVTATTAG